MLPAGTLIGQQSRVGRVLKRSGDITFSLALLSLGSPVLLLLALLVKLSSPGPVFYVQRRVGRGYQRFGCIKFRTMRPDADAVPHGSCRTTQLFGLNSSGISSSSVTLGSPSL